LRFSRGGLVALRLFFLGLMFSGKDVFLGFRRLLSARFSYFLPRSVFCAFHEAFFLSEPFRYCLDATIEKSRGGACFVFTCQRLTPRTVRYTAVNPAAGLRFSSENRNPVQSAELGQQRTVRGRPPESEPHLRPQPPPSWG